MRRTLKRCSDINFQPDIINLNDWQTALTCLYLRDFYSYKIFYRNIKSVFTVHNLQYQGIFDRNILRKISLDDKYFHYDKLEFYGNVSFIKALLTFLSFPFFIFAFIIPVLAEKPIISLVVIIFALITVITVRIKVRGVRQMMSASAYLFLMSQVIIMSYVYTNFMTIADNGGFQH